MNKVKWFFKQVKDFINGTWRSRKKIQKLFDDIMENRIQTENTIANEEINYQLKNNKPEDVRVELNRHLDKMPTSLDDLMRHYNPDVLEWYYKITSKLPDTRHPEIQDLKELDRLLRKYDEAL